MAWPARPGGGGGDVGQCVSAGGGADVVARFALIRLTAECMAGSVVLVWRVPSALTKTAPPVSGS